MLRPCVLRAVSVVELFHVRIRSWIDGAIRVVLFQKIRLEIV